MCYTVNTIIKTIFLVDPDNDIDSKCNATIVSDDQIAQFYGGLSRVVGSSAELKIIIYLDELIDGESYKPRYMNCKDFNAWQHIDSLAMEDEVANAIEKWLGHRSTLKRLPKKIMDANGERVMQQWDAVLYDEQSGHLYMAEAKHKVVPSDFDKLREKLNNLPDLLKSTGTKAYRHISHEKITIIIASAYFDEALRNRAQKEGYKCCYPSGDRYLIDPSY